MELTNWMDMRPTTSGHCDAWGKKKGIDNLCVTGNDKVYITNGHCK